MDNTQAEPTEQDFRAAGFTGEAVKYPKPNAAFIAFCAWNNVDPAKAPNTWRYAPNEGTLIAWQRVVDAVIKDYVGDAAIKDYVVVDLVEHSGD